MTISNNDPPFGLFDYMYSAACYVNQWLQLSIMCVGFSVLLISVEIEYRRIRTQCMHITRINNYIYVSMMRYDVIVTVECASWTGNSKIV